MRLRALFALVAGATLLALPKVARAQVDKWEFNAHAGAYRYDLGLSDENGSDNTDTDVLLGARLGRQWMNGVGIEGNFDYVFANQIPLGSEFEDHDINVSLLLYSAALTYTFPTAGIVDPFVSVGVGGASTTYADVPTELDAIYDNSTDLLVPLGGGLKILNDPDDPSWGVRVDVRDHLTFHDQINSDGEKKSVSDNNFELSGGISFFFGGTGYEEPEPIVQQPVDTDGDGVYDDRDRCPGTPLGTRVDAFGCPVPVDSDNDGVVDERDQCPNTPAGARVDENGCEIIEKPAACVDGRDWYRTDERITVEGGDWIKYGSSRTVAAESLIQIGEYDGVPVFVRTSARKPYQELLLPMCAPADSYQPYRPVKQVRGTTGCGSCGAALRRSAAQRGARSEGWRRPDAGRRRPGRVRGGLAGAPRRLAADDDARPATSVVADTTDREERDVQHGSVDDTVCRGRDLRRLPLDPGHHGDRDPQRDDRLVRDAAADSEPAVDLEPAQGVDRGAVQDAAPRARVVARRPQRRLDPQDFRGPQVAGRAAAVDRPDDDLHDAHAGRGVDPVLGMSHGGSRHGERRDETADPREPSVVHGSPLFPSALPDGRRVSTGPIPVPLAVEPAPRADRSESSMATTRFTTENHRRKVPS